MTAPAKEIAAGTMAVRTAVILFLFVIVFTGLLAGAYLWTKPAIEASAAEEKMRLVDEILPRGDYDNDLLKDTVTLPADPLLGTDEPSALMPSVRPCEFAASRGSRPASKRRASAARPAAGSMQAGRPSREGNGVVACLPSRERSVCQRECGAGSGSEELDTDREFVGRRE